VFGQWGDDSRSEDSASRLLESNHKVALAAATVRSSGKATQARVARRSRLPRYERESDAWFAELASEDAGKLLRIVTTA